MNAAAHRKEIASQAFEHSTYLLNVDGLAVAQLAYLGTTNFGKFNYPLGGNITCRIADSGAADSIANGEFSFDELDSLRLLILRNSLFEDVTKIKGPSQQCP